MCLVARAPMTGSEITRLLTRYPLAGTGKSPGAVYPALHRLQEARLVCSRPRWGDTARSRAIRGQVWRAVTGKESRRPDPPTVREWGLTYGGIVRLRGWASRRVGRTEVLERPEHLLLRFALCTGLVGPTATRRLALQCRRVCGELAAELVAELEGGGGASPSGRLALEWTLGVLEARVAWARRAEAALARHAARAPDLDLPSPEREVRVVVDRLPPRIRKWVLWPLVDDRKVRSRKPDRRALPDAGARPP